ncbi:MAG: tetratricopeptide repeat protein [Candidatus Paceibacterota bacterium]
MQKIFKSKYLPIILIVTLFAVSAVVIFISHKKDSAATPLTQSIDPKLDDSITKLVEAIKTSPSFAQNYFDLSNAYLQKARETGDSSYYDKIDMLMNTVASIDPENADVPATRASVAIGRHHFKEGKVFAEQAIAKNNHREIYYGLLGDAEIELGQYDEAVAAFQKMVDIHPGFTAYSRIAYIRELYGDIKGAKEMLNLAISSGSNFKENIAWAYVELGKLAMRDNLEDAKADFNQALVVLPTYTQAMEGLGKVAFAQGDTQGAIAHLGDAINGLALTQYSTDLADVYTATGNTQKAAEEIAVSQASFDLFANSGVDTDLEESLFLADHDTNISTAIVMAQRAYADRPNIYAVDYLSWALYKNGQYEEAGKYATQAFRLGEFDPLILFHQGMIAVKNNNTAVAKRYLAKAYALSPHFSIQYEKTLKDTLATLK